LQYLKKSMDYARIKKVHQGPPAKIILLSNSYRRLESLKIFKQNVTTLK